MNTASYHNFTASVLRLDYRFDNFLVPMQCTGNLDCFHVSIPLAVRSTLLRHMDMRSLTRAHKFGCKQYPPRGVRHKQVCARADSSGQKKLSLTLPHQGIEPRVFRFEFQLSNHWATSPVSCLYQVTELLSLHCFHCTFHPQCQHTMHIKIQWHGMTVSFNTFSLWCRHYVFLVTRQISLKKNPNENHTANSILIFDNICITCQTYWFKTTTWVTLSLRMLTHAKEYIDI